MWWVVLISLGVFLVGIVLWNILSASKSTKDSFVEKLAYYFEGRYEKVLDHKNTYRVFIAFERHDFIYEEIEAEGFREHKVQKAYIKAKTNSRLNIRFDQKKQGQIISPSMVTVSDLDTRQLRPVETQLMMPKIFKDFEVQTNDIQQFNHFLGDPKIVSVFESFKNYDNRGVPFSSLILEDGMLVLEFHTHEGYKPSITNLYRNIASLEDILEKLIVVIDKLNKLAAEDNK
jgi:hypothetical protein